VTLDALRPVADRALGPFVRLAHRLGIGPNTVSLAALGLAVLASGTFVRGGLWYLPGAALVLSNGWLDLLDGALARERGADSARGDLLDHALDRYADVALVAGLAAGTDRYALGFAAVTGVLLTSYLGTQAQAVGAGRTYAGAVGRADRLALIAVVAAAAGIASAVGADATALGLGPVGWLLVALAVAGHLTALQRLAGAWRALD
jgi:archaetidylinositol phosphate synthase